MRDVEKRQQIANDRCVRAAAQIDRQFPAEIARVEFLDCDQQRALTRVVHLHERPVDVPKQKRISHKSIEKKLQLQENRKSRRQEPATANSSPGSLPVFINSCLPVEIFQQSEKTSAMC